MAMVSKDCLRVAASSHRDARTAVIEVLDAIRPEDLAGVILFCSDKAHLDAAAQLRCQKEDIPWVGCTTAGEITPWGMLSGSVVAVGFPSVEFNIQTLIFDGLLEFDPFHAQRQIAATIADAAEWSAHLGETSSAGLLLIDGLSCREELITHTMRHILEDIPMVGGSAADQMQFRKTYILHGQTVRSDRAVLLLLTSRRRLSVFRCDHHSASDARVIITRADAATRKVYELNGRQAAEEFRRLIGAPRLTDQTLAEHTLMVRVGGAYYPRSITQAGSDGSLTFSSAIEDGLVLRLGQPANMVEAIQASIASMGNIDAVLAFECAHNWLEAQAAGVCSEVEAIYAHKHFVGFRTFGEQFRDLHLNRSLVGIGIGARDAA